MKEPISWKVEQYIFGPCALRNEIERRKENGERYGIFNEIGIRMLMVYGFAVGLIMVSGFIIYDGLCSLIMRLLRQKPATDNAGTEGD